MPDLAESYLAKALLMHRLISTLEGKAEDGIGEAWAELAEKQHLELECGAIQGATWQEVKNVVKGKTAA
jgi:hypothetical protein